MVLPLDEPLMVEAGEQINVRFEYRAGASIPSLQRALMVEIAGANLQVEERRLAFA
jgi:hypothetical protein